MTRAMQIPKWRRPSPAYVLSATTLSIVLLAACEPRVKVEAPDKPIVINLNVKIQHEVRVRVEKDVDTLLKKNPELF